MLTTAFPEFCHKTCVSGWAVCSTKHRILARSPQSLSPMQVPEIQLELSVPAQVEEPGKSPRLVEERFVKLLHVSVCIWGLSDFQMDPLYTMRTSRSIAAIQRNGLGLDTGSDANNNRSKKPESGAANGDSQKLLK